MPTRVKVKPELLEWACERAGHDTDAYTSRFPKLGEWVRGELDPTLKQLEQFARATHAPVGFFFLPSPPVENVPIPDFRTIQGKALRKPSPDLLETLFLCQERQEWFRDYCRSNLEDEKVYIGSLTIQSSPDEAASKIRDQLGFDSAVRMKARNWSDALRLFIETADDAGIMVMCSGVVKNSNHRRLDPEEFRGFAISDPLAPLLFINGADTKAAQIFTLAHELAHLWLGQSALSDTGCLNTSQNDVETWCNRVAAELLVPMVELKATFDTAGDFSSELGEAASRFKVSTLVILRRVYDAGFITLDRFRSEYNEELARLRAIKRGGGGNFYLTLPVRVGKSFAKALIASTLEGQTLHRDALRLLGFSKVSTLHKLGANLGVEV